MKWLMVVAILAIPAMAGGECVTTEYDNATIIRCGDPLDGGILYKDGRGGLRATVGGNQIRSDVDSSGIRTTTIRRSRSAIDEYRRERKENHILNGTGLGPMDRQTVITLPDGTVLNN